MTLESYVNSDLVIPKSQIVENLASRIQETNNIPDPYVFQLINGKISTLNSIPVEKFIEKSSYLGSREIIAFHKIEEWSTKMEAEKEVALWFSPPYQDFYPSAKVVISKVDQHNYLIINRAIKLEITGQELLALASILEKNINITSENLRSNPFFVDNRQFENFLKELALIDPVQHELLITGKDIALKEKTLAQIQEIRNKMSAPSTNHDRSSEKRLYKEAGRHYLIGAMSESCPYLIEALTSETPFQAFSDPSFFLKERKLIRNCGACKKRLYKYMSSGDRCPHCNGIYKGC